MQHSARCGAGASSVFVLLASLTASVYGSYADQRSSIQSAALDASRGPRLRVDPPNCNTARAGCGWESVEAFMWIDGAVRTPTQTQQNNLQDVIQTAMNDYAWDAGYAVDIRQVVDLGNEWEVKMRVHAEDGVESAKALVRDDDFAEDVEGRLNRQLVEAVTVEMLLAADTSGGEDEDEDAENEGTDTSEEEEEESFLKKYQLYILIGGGALGLIFLCCMVYCAVHCCCKKPKQPDNAARPPSNPAANGIASNNAGARPQQGVPLGGSGSRYGNGNGHAVQGAPVEVRPAQVPVAVPGTVVNGAQSTVVGAAMGAQSVVPFRDVQLGQRLEAWRGQGEVKEVHKAQCFGGDAVAVRVRKGVRDPREMSTALTKLCQHPNINTFLGASQAPQGDVVLVMQWHPRGSLRHFLQEHQGFLSVPERLDACRQVCDAMAFLAAKEEVHGHLAACNVLVVSFYPANVMVTDFGLAGMPGLNDGSDARLARWSAPECMETGTFSLSGDVWSFGVLMWEVFADAGLPYHPNHQRDEEVRTYVVGGGRLEKPKHAPAAVYSQMWKCWRDVGERPKMDELLQVFVGWRGRDLGKEEADGEEEEGEEDAGLAEAGLCQMCLDAPRTVLCLPCRHASLCRDCFELVMDKDGLCVICRAPIEGSEGGEFMQTFLRADNIPVPGSLPC